MTPPRQVLRFGHPVLCTALTTIAVSAFAGAAGLITGFLDLGTTATQRLPFSSPVFGGVALAFVVGVPLTIAARLAYVCDRRVPTVTIFVGGLLIVWILIELAFIRELSFLHPLFIALGAAFTWAGLRMQQQPADPQPEYGRRL